MSIFRWCMPFRDMVHRHLRLRETLSERREIWYTDAVQRVLFNGAGFGVLWCRCTCNASARWGSSDFEIV